MKNAYVNLSAAQVKAIADVLGENFNIQQIGGILEVLDTGVGRATQTSAGTMLQAATVAAAAVPFADLTAAANAFNGLRTVLRNAGIVA